MTDLYKVEISNQDDIDAMTQWCNEVYTANFGSHFKRLHSMADMLSSDTRPMTNEELEWALSTVPLQMLEVAEILNRFRVNEQLMKLKIKQSLRDTSTTEVTLQSIEENRLLALAYSSVVGRAENELSACREFVMAAKKIWDARQKSAIPIGPVDTTPQLPTYIRGGQ